LFLSFLILPLFCTSHFSHPAPFCTPSPLDSLEAPISTSPWWNSLGRQQPDFPLALPPRAYEIADTRATKAWVLYRVEWLMPLGHASSSSCWAWYSRWATPYKTKMQEAMMSLPGKHHVVAWWARLYGGAIEASNQNKQGTAVRNGSSGNKYYHWLAASNFNQLRNRFHATLFHPNLNITLVETRALAPVCKCHLHRFYNRCNASGTKALTL
jgi:hypothetical protein